MCRSLLLYSKTVFRLATLSYALEARSTRDQDRTTQFWKHHRALAFKQNHREVDQRQAIDTKDLYSSIKEDKDLVRTNTVQRAVSHSRSARLHSSTYFPISVNIPLASEISRSFLWRIHVEHYQSHPPHVTKTVETQSYSWCGRKRNCGGAVSRLLVLYTRQTRTSPFKHYSHRSLSTTFTTLTSTTRSALTTLRSARSTYSTNKYSNPHD